jgi:hypothetical protein
MDVVLNLRNHWPITRSVGEWVCSAQVNSVLSRSGEELRSSMLFSGTKHVIDGELLVTPYVQSFTSRRIMLWHCHTCDYAPIYVIPVEQEALRRLYLAFPRSSLCIAVTCVSGRCYSPFVSPVLTLEPRDTGFIMTRSRHQRGLLCLIIVSCVKCHTWVVDHDYLRGSGVR